MWYINHICGVFIIFVMYLLHTYIYYCIYDLHVEYLYRVLTGNKYRLPEQALYMIRYHSFYPWHTHSAYKYLCDDKDKEMLPWIQSKTDNYLYIISIKFTVYFCSSQFDLYSKADKLPDRDALMLYYQGLIDKYIPGEICW